MSSMEPAAAPDEEEAGAKPAPLELDAAGDERAIERSALRKIGWRVIPLVALTEWISNVDKTNIGFAAVGTCAADTRQPRASNG